MELSKEIDLSVRANSNSSCKLEIDLLVRLILTLVANWSQTYPLKSQLKYLNIYR